MPFDTFTPRRKAVALGALAYCKRKYGGNGLKIGEGIATEIAWRPVFFLRPSRYHILAVEVDEIIYPEVLKGAAQDIGHFDSPITVYQACSLDAYQKDPNQTRVNLLRAHGIGLITVDEQGNARLQHSCTPLAQNISPEQLEGALDGLIPTMKVKFRSAYDTYASNEGQGLQQAGQVVEAMVKSMGAQAEKAGIISHAAATGNVADLIDALYATPQFEHDRAALGAARDFAKESRNSASHPSNSAKNLAEKIRKCKSGFLDAIGVAIKLRIVAQKKGYRLQIHTT